MENANTIKTLRRSLSEISAIMYKIYVKCFVSVNPVTEGERIAGNMYRMMIFKAKSIWLMSKGIVIVRTQKGIIPDPSTMYSVLRSLYELLFLFRCMFASSKNGKERELLLNLWKIKGNNNLTQIPNELLDEASANDRESANEENEVARRKIRERMRELSLPQSAINNIENIIKPNNISPTLKGFMFEHCEKSDNISGFSALAFSDETLGAELSGDGYIYSHYSAHSHPSYLGVKHFEEMYPNEEENRYVQEVLVHSCKYLGRFMKEFCEYRDSYRPFYKGKENRINTLMNRISQDLLRSPTSP